MGDNASGNAFYTQEDSSPAYVNDSPLFEDQSTSEDHEALESFLSADPTQENPSSEKKKSWKLPFGNPFTYLSKKFKETNCLKYNFIDNRFYSLCQRAVGGTVIYPVLFLGWSSAIIVFVFTCMQFSNNEETEKGSTFHELDSDTGGCATESHRPLRFRFVSDPEFLYCGWATSNQVYRMLWCFAGAFSPILCILAIRKQKKWLMWIFIGLAFIITILFFWVMCSDANAVRISTSWCEDGMEGVVFNPPGIKFECNNFPYVLTCLLDAATVLIWAGVVVASVKHARIQMSPPSIISRGVI